jgi:hypothetical protein
MTTKAGEYWVDGEDDGLWAMLEDLVGQVWGEPFTLLLERDAFKPLASHATTRRPTAQQVRGFARLLAATVQLLHTGPSPRIRPTGEFEAPIVATRTCDGFGMWPWTADIWQTPQVGDTCPFDGWFRDDPADSDDELDPGHEFVPTLLRVLSAIPSAAWSQLTIARRVCLAADLGELIRISNDLEDSSFGTIATGVLIRVCAGDADLINVARIAGEALEHHWGPLSFAFQMEQIQELSERLLRS